MATGAFGACYRQPLGASRRPDGDRPPQRAIPDPGSVRKLKSLSDTSKECGTLPLSSEQMLTFMQLIAMELEWPDWRVAEEEANNPWVVLIKDRLVKAGCEASDHLVLFLSGLCQEPAQAIAWAYTICHLREHSGKKPTLNLMAERYFPSGTPSTQAYRRCWDAQRSPAGNANLMDVNANWSD